MDEPSEKELTKDEVTEEKLLDEHVVSEPNENELTPDEKNESELKDVKTETIKEKEESKKKSKVLWLVIGIIIVVIVLIILFKSGNEPEVVETIEVDDLGPEVEALVITDHTCKECATVIPLLEQLRGQGVNLKIIEKDVKDASKEIEKHKILYTPVVILSPELKEYSNVHAVWHNFGTITYTGEYVLRYVDPPFKEINGTIRGFVDVIYLTDKSCEACYDVLAHKEVLDQAEVKINDEKFIDIKSIEGFKLIEKYKITLVPTILINNELAVYPLRVMKWDRVGSKEEDGTYVFRNIGVMQGAVYKDLETGEIVS